MGRHPSSASAYWEPRRAPFNLALALIVVAQIAWTWPRSRAQLGIAPLGPLLALVVLANIAYSTAYFADIAIRRTSAPVAWRLWRHAVWMAGTIVAGVLTWLWIVDEIVPSLPQA
jgi:hypothetical protein